MSRTAMATWLRRPIIKLSPASARLPIPTGLVRASLESWPIDATVDRNGGIMTDDADRIISLYDGHALAFDKDRSRTLFEKSQLDQFRGLVRRGGSILDIGCGMGEAIASYLIAAGHGLAGGGGSPTLIGLCRARFPRTTWAGGDLRPL